MAGLAGRRIGFRMEARECAGLFSLCSRFQPHVPNMTASRSVFAASAVQPVVAALNHLLMQEPWAASSLRPFAGKTVRFNVSPLDLSLQVAPDGMVAAAPNDAEPAVTLTVPLAATPNMLVDYASAGQAGVMKHVRIEGDAELANTVSQLVQHLRWEAADDLSRIFGDIVAQRMVTGAGRMRDSALQVVRGLRDSVTEYLVEERPTLVRRAELEDMSAGIGIVRNDLARLEKRLARLEAAVGNTSASTSTDTSATAAAATPGTRPISKS